MMVASSMITDLFSEVLWTQVVRHPEELRFDALHGMAVRAFVVAFGDDEGLPDAATCWRSMGFARSELQLQPPAAITTGEADRLLERLRCEGVVSARLPRHSRLHVSYRDGDTATTALIVLDEEDGA